MKNSLKNTILITTPWLDPNITSPEDIHKIHKISSNLPNLPLVSAGGFECHLGDNYSGTDFSVCLNPQNVDRKILRSGFKKSQVLSDQSSIWQRVNNFIDRWNSENSKLYTNVVDTWMEFDVNSSEEKMMLPSFFFSPLNINSNNCQNSENFQWIFSDALELILQKPLDTLTVNCLTRCFQLLPTNGNVFQLGVMLPRESESSSVRVCINGILIRDIPCYLKRIGYPESTHKLTYILNKIDKFVDGIAIGISIDRDRVSSKIGFECYIKDRAKDSLDSLKWRDFLDFLLSENLCTLEESTSLTKWIGYSEENSHREVWPINFTAGKVFMQGQLRSTIVRTLHHVKISYNPNQPLVAKAYLWFAHRWLNNNGEFVI